jgi:hypothetical protein
MHTIIGGSNFDKSLDYAGTQKGQCTTAPISIDKSSYWTRKLIPAITGPNIDTDVHAFDSSIVQLFCRQIQVDPR